MSDKVLVTGGAGFIGSHVCERLIERGLVPLVLDNLSTGKRENLPDGVEFVEGDIRNLPTLLDLVPRTMGVVHLAAVASVARSVEDPIETHASNYTGTLSLLEAVRRTGLKPVIYASSAAVYPPSDEASREDGSVRPSSPYGLDKLMGEHALRIYRELHNLPSIALRFFNIYGERQDPHSPYSGVISIFLSRLVQGQPIRIDGTGEQTRDFVYVRDLARLIVDLLNDSEAPPLMNVGTGRRTSILELVRTLEEVLGRPTQVAFGPPRHGDIPHSQADISLLAADPSRVPQTSLGEGLARLAAWTRR